MCLKFNYLFFLNFTTFKETYLYTIINHILFNFNFISYIKYNKNNSIISI